jgi:hypothetical protein
MVSWAALTSPMRRRRNQRGGRRRVQLPLPSGVAEPNHYQSSVKNPVSGSEVYIVLATFDFYGMLLDLFHQLDYSH